MAIASMPRARALGPGLLLVVGMMLSGPARLAGQQQIVTPAPLVQFVLTLTDVSIEVFYDTSTGDDMLSGLGLSLYFDSTQLTYLSDENILPTGLLSVQMQLDDGDGDGDPNTDIRCIFAWATLPVSWPGETLPVRLFRTNFTTTSSFTGTTIRFTADGTTAANYTFASTPAQINLLQLVPPVADAGDDQTVADLTEVELDGMASDSFGVPVTYSWLQTVGTPVTLAGASTLTPTFLIPDLDDDETFRFTLTIDGPGGSDSDEVEIRGIDADQRITEITLPAEPTVQVLEGGTQALVFEGTVSWGTTLEDGLWTGVRVRGSGTGNEASLLDGLSVFLDANDDGVFDPGDEQLGETAIPGSDNQEVLFDFSSNAQMLVEGNPRRFFLIADLPVPGGGAGTAAVLWPLLLLWGLGVLGLARSRRLRSVAGRFVILLCLASLPLVTFACSHGGGSKPAAKPASTEVQFELLELITEGAGTGVSGTTSGLPVEGPPLVL